MSPTVGKLTEALSKAQGCLEGAKKDALNPYFKSQYSTLSSVWDACRKPLADNGLAVIQTSELMDAHPDLVCIQTILCHTSGEWVKSRLAVKPVKSDPQSVGSCITYLRRYSLQAMIGIAPEDDDGNSASGKNPNIEPITDEQQTVINGIIEDKKVDLVKFLAHMKVESISQIIGSDYQKAIAVLKAARGQK